MRLGLLGGTFDPPHVGHLLAASDAVEALALDRLVLIPAATSPFKTGDARASAGAAERLEMVRRAVAGDPRFAVDPIEIQRDGLSYSVDTLATFAERFPRAERFFLVGFDAMMGFPGWREPGRILRLARVAVLRRSAAAVGGTARPLAEAEGAAAESETGEPAGNNAAAEVRARVAEVFRAVRAEGGPDGAGEPPAPLLLPTRRVDVSSTEIRARVRAGRPIRGFVPDAVADFISASGLYR